MKYIRTTDGRIVNRLSEFNCFKSHGTTGRYIVRTLEDDNDLELWLKYNRTSVINQADTIEELCDEFICGDNYKAHCVLSSESFENSYWKERLLDNDKTVIIYGAIWTDKGLIYIAKMNERGELELL